MFISTKRFWLPLVLSLAFLGWMPMGQPSAYGQTFFRVRPVAPWYYPHQFHSFVYPPAYPSYPMYSMYYNPYAYGSYVQPDPYGGYLKGAADVINSQGQYLKATQEAYLLKEQVRAAQIQNRRKAYEEWLWEQNNTPTLNEQRERLQREELRRSLNNPPITEVWSAKSLNDILTNLQELGKKGYEGPAVALEGADLKSINVTSGKGPANTGLLKEAGKLSWPSALRTLPPEAQTRELRAQIDGLLDEAKKQAVLRGKVDAGTTTELDRSIDALRKLLASQIGDFSFSDYSESRRFLGQLDDAVKVLQQPDAGNYLTGKFSAQGATVKELVKHMSENGLRFAPAVSGEEAAYTALYQALAQYQAAVAKQMQSR
jgi:hypothetical protein